MGPPWGTWGPYLGIPSVEYFPNVFFWASWTPWASPYLQMQWRPPKNFKKFQGAVISAWPFFLNGLLSGAEGEACAERVMAPHLASLLCPKRGCTVYRSIQHALAIFSKTNHTKVFSPKQQIDPNKIGWTLVIVLGLIRVMCGEGVTLLAFGTRKYWKFANFQPF